MSDETEPQPTQGWRDQPGGDLLWRLILEAFARSAS